MPKEAKTSMFGTQFIASQLQKSTLRIPAVTRKHIGAGSLIDFQTPGSEVYGAVVLRKEFFCGEWNYFVKYTFESYDHRECEMTGWVAQSAVLS